MSTSKDIPQGLTEADTVGDPDLFDEDDRKLHRKNLVVKKSNIPGAGLGVFAKRKIKKDDWVGTLAGPIVGTDGRYVLHHQQEDGVIYQDAKGPLRYCNHSAVPNIDIEFGSIDETWALATRDIAKGEEILWNYGRTEEELAEAFAAAAKGKYETDVDDLAPRSVVKWLEEREILQPMLALAGWLDRFQYPKEGSMSNRQEYEEGERSAALKRLIHQISFKERTEDEEPWKLKSGRESRVYFDLRPLLLQGLGLDLATMLVVETLDDIEEGRDGRLDEESGDEFDAVAGVLDGGASLATAVGRHYWTEEDTDVPILLVRKEAKDHGMKGLLIGTENLPKGSSVIIIEDVATTGGSALRAAAALREQGYQVNHCVVVLDREEGAREAMIEERIVLHSLFTKSAFSDRE